MHSGRDPAAIEINRLGFSWPGRPRKTLSIGALSVSRGESLFLHGASGCGKSTLLSAIAGTVDVPTGTIKVCGQDIAALRGGARDRFRGDHLGVIFQVFNLVPWLSTLENVLLPCRYSARRAQRAGPAVHATAQRLLEELGLGDPGIAAAQAATLSVGQQQRVAAARALVGRPDLILADEPTSALDEDAKTAFVDLLQRESREAGSALLFVSHDRSLMGHFDLEIAFADINRTEVAAC